MKKHCLLLGKRNCKDSQFFQWQRLTWSAQQPDLLEPKGSWCWRFLTLLISMSIFAPLLCWILLCSIPFMNMYIPPKPLPQFCCLNWHHFRKDPWCSPYFLQGMRPSFRFWLGCLLGPHSPRGESNFWVAEASGNLLLQFVFCFSGRS